jgi:hypothetical protein
MLCLHSAHTCANPHACCLIHLPAGLSASWTDSSRGHLGQQVVYCRPLYCRPSRPQALQKPRVQVVVHLQQQQQLPSQELPGQVLNPLALGPRLQRLCTGS